MISIVIQRLLLATCLTVTQYIAHFRQSQHFFQRFLAFFGANCASGVGFGGICYDSRGDFSVFCLYLSIVAQIVEKVNSFYGLIWGVCQLSAGFRVYRGVGITQGNQSH